MTTARVESAHATLLGDALVEQGHITQQQLDRGKKIQTAMEQKRPLGEVLIELGYTSRQAISNTIAAFGKSLRLGEILFEQGLINLDALETALNVQKEKGTPLGEVLVELGVLNERTLTQNLANQFQVPYIEPSFGMLDTAILAGISPDFLEKHLFVPFCKGDDGKITVVVSDLEDESILQALEDVYQDNYSLALGPSDTLRQTIGDIKQFRVKQKEKGSGRIDEGDNAVAQLIDHTFAEAIDERASDIHIEPMSEAIRVRYRVDGALVLKTNLPRELLPKIISRLKILAECNITEVRRHQGGRMNFTHNGEDYDMRLSCYVTVHGECAVIRILHKQMGLVSLDQLGMTGKMDERYRLDVLELSSGVVIITGPTGSGKTTTLYSSLDYCNRMDVKIITAEDPVEFMIDGLVQCTIEDNIGRTFESSLREIVRQDPDIIVLGEIRDKQTAETAIHAALTGHKVYCTFHTEDSIGALVRLLNMDIEAFLISATVAAVAGQRLLRRTCELCADPYVPSSTELGRLDLDHAEIRQYDFKKGRGCKGCAYTGYRGRIAAYELLVINDPIKVAVLEGRPAYEIRRIAIETAGLLTMREDGIAKVIRGYTTFEEVLRQTPKTYATRPLGNLIASTK